MGGHDGVGFFAPAPGKVHLTAQCVHACDESDLVASGPDVLERVALLHFPHLSVQAEHFVPTIQPEQGVNPLKERLLLQIDRLLMARETFRLRQVPQGLGIFTHALGRS